MRPVTTLSVEDMGINYGINLEEEKEWRCLIALFRCYNCYEHHALDAYRIPDVIKRASSQITIATFSDLWGYKKEAFQASTRSPKILADAVKSMSFNIISMSFLCHLTTLERTASSENIGKVFIDVDTIIESNSSLNGKNINISIIVKDGLVEFIGTNCTNTIDIVTRNSPEVIGLNGGYILPGMIAVGT
ncbi:hypothetical protein RhiirA4_445504 [Rhizophagus irregularis]|uniref:Uncharacterized protein n=1 Tax=Rhizophagus irregularis TaxID=588596 RepID=A0A2I1GQ28_9GLOM|nr:hypothetical protein RhiirA4_445504 [Rhizophagus irregularis]